METKEILLKLRTEKGLSQEELAEKVMVTRQSGPHFWKVVHCIISGANNQLLTTVSIQIGTVFFYNDISLLRGLYDKNRFLWYTFLR